MENRIVKRLKKQAEGSFTVSGMDAQMNGMLSWDVSGDPELIKKLNNNDGEKMLPEEAKMVNDAIDAYLTKLYNSNDEQLKYDMHNLINEYEDDPESVNQQKLTELKQKYNVENISELTDVATFDELRQLVTLQRFIHFFNMAWETGSFDPNNMNYNDFYGYFEQV